MRHRTWNVRPSHRRSRTAPHGHLHGQRGTVTAEFAVILPAVVAMAALICVLGRAVILRVDCQDAAHTIARQAISDLTGGGEVPDAFRDWALQTAHTLAGDAAHVDLTAGSGTETTLSVTVSAPLVADPWGILPRLVSGRAVALLE